MTNHYLRAMARVQVAGFSALWVVGTVSLVVVSALASQSVGANAAWWLGLLTGGGSWTLSAISDAVAAQREGEFR